MSASVPAVPPVHGPRPKIKLRAGLLLLITMATLSFAACGGSDSPTSPSSNAGSVSSLSIVGSPVLITGMTGYRFTAFAQQSNLVTSDVTSSAAWTSSNTQVAVFTSAGYVNTLRAGAFTVTAAYGGRTATMSVSVQ